MHKSIGGTNYMLVYVVEFKIFCDSELGMKLTNLLS